MTRAKTLPPPRTSPREGGFLTQQHIRPTVNRCGPTRSGSPSASRYRGADRGERSPGAYWTHCLRAAALPLPS